MWSMNFTPALVLQKCVLEPQPPTRKPATSPGTSCFRATQKALWEESGERAQALGCPTNRAHLPTSYPSLLCKDGTGQFSRILYLGMAAGFKCVSGLWQRKEQKNSETNPPRALQAWGRNWRNW